MTIFEAFFIIRPELKIIHYSFYQNSGAKGLWRQNKGWIGQKKIVKDLWHTGEYRKNEKRSEGVMRWYTVKKGLGIFPSPAGMLLTLPGRE
jgi:hypothetical protein